MNRTKISRRALLAAPLLWLPPRASARAQAERQRVEMAGIPFYRLRHGESRLRLLRIHGNEETAREAVERLIGELPGEAWIVDSRTRHIVLDGLRLDPNRMFSREGAEKNLRLLNPEAPPERVAALLDRLDRERPALMERLAPPPGGLWIAAHNNGPGYSMDTEAPISQKIHRPRPEEPRNFLLFSSEKDFEIAAGGPFNAVLQNRPGGEDDGSLSRWCASRGVRYVNVEAAHGELERQMEMLRWLAARLP
ncbi:MAG: hypothetical protein WHT08_03790 [Bryobacteraceae bacterium]